MSAEGLRSLRAVAAREFIHDINERVEASVGVRPRFDELLDARAQAPVGFLEAPVSFFGVPTKRHGHVHQLANRAAVRLDHPQRVGLHLFEYLNVGSEPRLLLDDEIHARFDVVGHGEIIA